MALSSHALTLLSTIETELGLTSGAETAILERLINGVSEEIERYCNRHFEYVAANVEKTAGYGTPLLVLARRPVLSIASITLDGVAVDAADYTIDDAGAGLIRSLAGAWEWTAGYAAGSISVTRLPGTEERDYVVTYASGYVTPGQVGGSLTRSLPYDIENACIEAVVTQYRERGENLRVRSEGMQTARFDYGDRNSLPVSVRDKLLSYREAV